MLLCTLGLDEDVVFLSEFADDDGDDEEDEDGDDGDGYDAVCCHSVGGKDVLAIALFVFMLR